MKNTIAGVDLAKEVIQVCICAKNKVHSNTDMSHSEFLIWLFKSCTPSAPVGHNHLIV